MKVHRPRGRGRVVVVVVAVVTALAGSGLVPGPVAATTGDPPIITNLAGGLGAGNALSVGQTPVDIAVGPDLTNPDEPVPDGMIYVADQTFNVVRAVRLATGHERVLAGTGEIGYSGDGGPATEATLRLRALDGTKEPAPGLAVDADGHVYLADTQNHVIRRIDATTGIITTVAGTGTAGFSGDGGPAVEAELSSPSGLGFDSAGHLFIADTGNHRVRALLKTLNSPITTWAGSGTTGAFGGDGGVATSARLNGPTGVALDGDGNLFIADKGNCRVRKVSRADLVISTVAGTGSGASACSYDGDGAVATSKKLKDPYGVAVDASGNIYIADQGNCIVRMVGTGTGIITTVAGAAPGATPDCGFDGDGTATKKLNLPNRVVVAGGEVLIADTGNARVRSLAGAELLTVVGNGTPGYSGDGGFATDAQLGLPERLTIDGDGHVYVADTDNHAIRRIDADTGEITTVAGTGTAGFSGDGDPATAAKLNSPHGVAVNAAGDLFVADTANCVIRKVAADGTISTVVGTAPSPSPNCGSSGNLVDLVPDTAKLNMPEDVAVSGAGDLYIADTDNHVIRVLSSGILNVFAGTAPSEVEAFPGNTGDGGPATSATLDTPRGVSMDTDGTVYIADTLNSRVRKVVDGTITAFAGSGTVSFSGDGGPATAARLAYPYALSAGPDGVFIADTFNDRVRLVRADGTITTVAGTGDRGNDGDGGEATAATLDRPRGVVAGATGVFVLADTFNNRLRLVAPPPAVAPDPPIAVMALPGDGEVVVSWTAPADDGGSPVTKYTVHAYEDGTLVDTADTADGTTLTATVTGLTNGTAYTFTVSATNVVGEGDPSTPSPAATPRTVPGAPTAVTAVAGDGGATVSWTAPADDGGAPVNSYSVEARAGETVAKTVVVDGAETSVSVTGLTNGTAYTFVVIATNEAGDGPASSASAVVTPVATDPGGSDPGPDPSPDPGRPASGYWMVGEPGAVFAFGDSVHAGNVPVSAPAVDIESTPSGNGYWVVDAGGHVYAFGDASHLGGINGALPFGETVTSMSSTASGTGYWLFTTRGRVVVFGDAVSYGDISAMALNGPVLDSVTTPSGNGYYMVASDGGVFAFGDAAFHGSMGGTPLNAPVRSLVGDPDGAGYWLVASDGGIFAFDAPFYGSMGDTALAKPVVRMVAFGAGGYLMVGEDGGIFSFGSAPFHGSLGANPPPFPIRSVAVLHRAA